MDPGRHTVRFRYLPFSFISGAFISGLVLVILIIILVLPKYRIVTRKKGCENKQGKIIDT